MIRALLAAALLCAACHPSGAKPAPAPSPPIHSPPAVADSGVEMCDRLAESRAADIAAAAASERLSVLQATRVFEAACAPFTDDGADAAITSGLAAARNARAALVTDAGPLLERNPYR